VADDHIGLDVLSSQMDVKTSNFRRVPALPIYGCAQPSSRVSQSTVTRLYYTVNLKNTPTRKLRHLRNARIFLY